MTHIFRNHLRIKEQGIRNPDRICAMCTQKQLGIVKIIKIVNRIACAEFDPLNFLQIYIKHLLGSRCSAAKADTVKGFPQGVSELTVEQRRK